MDTNTYNPSENCEPRFYDEIYVKHEYDFGIPQKDDMVVVDIGSHIGIFTQYIYEKASVIHAIEPNKDNYRRLIARIIDNKMYKVIPRNIAIASSLGIMPLYSNGRDGDFSLKYKTETYDKVVTMALGEFMDIYKIGHIDLLKIDCEGSEEDILTSVNFDTYATEIDTIVGEYHSGVSMEELQKLMESYKYKVTVKGIKFHATHL